MCRESVGREQQVEGRGQKKADALRGAAAFNNPKKEIYLKQLTF